MATDKPKAVQNAHTTKMKKQMKPPKSMMGVCKGYESKEKGK